MFLGFRNGEGKHLLLAVIALPVPCFGYAIRKGAGIPDFSSCHIFVTSTLIGKNNTPIAKTARLLVLWNDIKNYYHLVSLNCFIAFSLKKIYFFLNCCYCQLYLDSKRQFFSFFSWNWSQFPQIQQMARVADPVNSLRSE